jgi:hypothetical protein
MKRDYIAMLRGAHLPYIAYNPALAKAAGGVACGVLLGQMLNLAALHGDTFYRTMTQLLADTGLTEREYRVARARLLADGFITVKRIGIPGKNHWTVAWSRVAEALEEAGSVQTSSDTVVLTGEDTLVLTGEDTLVRTNKNNKKNNKENKPSPDKTTVWRGEVRTFEQWWAMYPKKVAKQAAVKAWNRLTDKQRESAYEDCISRVWAADSQYDPNPATYLNGRRWEDEPKPREPYPWEGAI